MLHYERTRRLAIPIAGVMLVGLTLPWSWAEKPTNDDKNDNTTNIPNLSRLGQIQTSPVGAARGVQAKSRFRDFAEVTQGMDSMPGLFTLYRHPRGDRSKDPETLYARIPSSLLNQDLLFATSLSSGGTLTGFMWNDYLVRWQIAGSYLKLMTPDTRYIQAPGATTTDAVRRTYAPRYIAAARILSMTRTGDVLIDLGPLLKSNIADISFLGGGVRADLSTWSKVKNFPENTLIETNLALSQGQGGSTAGVAYVFRKLPNERLFESRPADSRVGYFLTVRADFSKDPSARTTIERYINRWKLEKRDPSLKLSPPKEPITFIIEDTVPIRWRRWVREGIEMWNVAFEKIGYDQAIVAHQQTRDNAWADIDPEDSRYNFIRWIVSGRAFAMGPSRTDPRTGQILDADILFDDSFVRNMQESYSMFTASKAARLYGEGFYEYLKDNREFLPGHLRARLESEERSPDDLVWDKARQHMHKQGRCFCSYAEGMQQQLAFGQLSLLAAEAKASEEDGEEAVDLERFVGQTIRMIIAHEVGHTLGLRHNFKASNWLDLDEIKRRRDKTQLPTTASVMDYNPTLFFPGDDPRKVPQYSTPVVGPYDVWAIEYGYSDLKGKPDEALAKIASRGSERALRYGPDEDSYSLFSADPFIRRYDLGTDPVEYAKMRTQLADNLLANIKDWAIKDGEAKYYLTRSFNILLSERMRNYSYVAGVIGGQNFSRAHKGDPNAPAAFTLVEPDLQREALDALGETLFNADFFEMDPALLNELSNARWWDWADRPEPRMDYPIHDRIRMMQVFALLNISAPPVLQRLYDAELKSTSADKFTVAELIKKTSEMIWDLDTKGTFTDANPMLNSITRNLQREHLSIMLMSVQIPPGMTMSADIQAMMRQSLHELGEKIAGVLKQSKPDFASRAHLRESHSRIQRVLEAQFIAR